MKACLYGQWRKYHGKNLLLGSELHSAALVRNKWAQSPKQWQTAPLNEVLV
jgi:hypothetical protein